MPGSIHERGFFDLLHDGSGDTGSYPVLQKQYDSCLSGRHYFRNRDVLHFLEEQQKVCLSRSYFRKWFRQLWRAGAIPPLFILYSAIPAGLQQAQSACRAAVRIAAKSHFRINRF